MAILAEVARQLVRACARAVSLQLAPKHLASSAFFCRNSGWCLSLSTRSSGTARRFRFGVGVYLDGALCRSAARHDCIRRLGGLCLRAECCSLTCCIWSCGVQYVNQGLTAGDRDVPNAQNNQQTHHTQAFLLRESSFLAQLGSVPGR